MPMTFNLKDFLDFASHRNPKAVAQAVIATAKQARRGMSGMGDASNLPDLSYLTDPSLSTVDVSLPSPGSVVYSANGVAGPSTADATTNTSGSLADTAISILNNLTAAAPQLLTAYTANKQLSACAQANATRAAQNLAPLDCSSFAPTAQVGLSPSTQSMLTLALLGGGALILFSMMRK